MLPDHIQFQALVIDDGTPGYRHRGPATQGSKKHVGRGRLVEVSKNLPRWRALVSAQAAAALAEQRGGIMFPGPVAVVHEYVLYRPSSLSPRKPTPPATKRPDLDKLERAVLDAITHIVIADDAAVVGQLSHKRLAEPGEAMGLHISIWEYR